MLIGIQSKPYGASHSTATHRKNEWKEESGDGGEGFEMRADLRFGISDLKTTAILLIFYSSCLSAQSTSYKTIYFHSNSYKIEDKYLAALNEIGLKCSSGSFNYLKIFAYADTTGSGEYNIKLSQKRAESVYDYLMNHYRIDSTKVYMTWLGEDTDAAYDLHFPQAHLQQRCVDILYW